MIGAGRGGGPRRADLALAPLEIVRDNGEPVRMPPPPTPGRPNIIMMAPGQRRSVLFRAFVSAPAPSGLYRVRLRYRDARSEWVELEIA